MFTGLAPKDRSFVIRAILSLTISVIIIIILQYVGYRIQNWEIEQDTNTATLVSLSSEQRTLSQRVAMLTLALLTVKSPLLREKTGAVLEQTVSEMERNHQALVTGNVGSSVSLPPSIEIQNILTSAPHSINQKVQEFIATARAIVQETSHSINAENPNVVKVTSLSSELLPAFGVLRDHYKKEGVEGIARLQFLALATFWSMVTAACAMGIGIFIPLLRKLANEFYQSYQHQLDLEDQNRELEQFAAIVAHDLKAPLNNIGGFSQFLRSKLSETEDSDTLRIVQRIEQGTSRMGNMISELLQYVRVSSKERVFENVPVAKVIKKITTDFESVLKESGAKIQTGSLPHVWGDPVQIEHLFHNLISNALKYRSPERSAMIHIHSKYIEDDMLQVTIDDNGMGLPPGTEEKIFEPFRRLPETSNVEGTGFGLSLCKKIVRRHRGTIAAQNREQGGARFIICLPTKPTWAESS